MAEKRDYYEVLGVAKTATAEEIKMQIGCATPLMTDMSMEIRGRDLTTGLPKNIKITSTEILKALKESISQIVETVKATLEKTPPELAADISDKGIYMTGGGCLVDGLDKLLQEKLGINVQESFGKIICSSDEIKGTEINLDFPSVGATENIILATVLGKGNTVIRNAAMEPEIEDLQNFLNRMGAKVEGAGTKTIKIKGVQNLKDVSYNIMPDRIEAGTLLCATAVTGGRIVLEKVNNEHIKPVIDKLEEAGCKIEIEKDLIILDAPKKLKAVEINTMPYPGFPTDMQAIFGATLCTATGISIITENIFESRFKYAGELQRMGAKIKIKDKCLIIKGVKKLYGTKVEATDLRGGASLIVAALKAKGKTEIEDIKYILRGYEKIEEKLSDLGADIKVLLN